jgi:hypothetical protein
MPRSAPRSRAGRGISSAGCATRALAQGTRARPARRHFATSLPPALSARTASACQVARTRRKTIARGATRDAESSISPCVGCGREPTSSEPRRDEQRGRGLWDHGALRLQADEVRRAKRIRNATAVSSSDTRPTREVVRLSPGCRQPRGPVTGPEKASRVVDQPLERSGVLRVPSAPSGECRHQSRMFLLLLSFFAGPVLREALR